MMATRIMLSAIPKRARLQGLTTEGEECAVEERGRILKREKCSSTLTKNSKLQFSPHLATLLPSPET